MLVKDIIRWFPVIKSGGSPSKCGWMAIASALAPDFELKSG